MEAVSPYRDGLRVQLRDAYGRVIYTYTTYLKMMSRLDKNNRRSKCVQIVLSAVSTGGFIGSMITNQFVLTVIGGIFSTALLGLNLFFKEISLSDQSKQCRVASDNLWLIRERYISLLTDFDVLSDDEIAAKRDELQALTYDVYTKSIKTDVKSYKAAQRALKTDEEQYFTPDEIDRMLPAHLRI